MTRLLNPKTWHWPGRTPRCRSCDHLRDDHQEDGCWFTVTQGQEGENLVCVCRVPLEPEDTQ